MAQSLCAVPSRRRHIAPQDGRALEILGHAIEYLTDEYIHRNGAFVERDSEMEAVRLLMELNREIYFSCLEVPGWSDRLASWLRLRQKDPNDKN